MFRLPARLTTDESCLGKRPRQRVTIRVSANKTESCLRGVLQVQYLNFARRLSYVPLVLQLLDDVILFFILQLFARSELTC